MASPRAIEKLIGPIARRVRLLARRAVVRLVYDDPKMQELQLAIFAGEVRDRVERWEDYGMTSHPHPGAEAIVLALGGNTDHGAVIKVADRRYRLTALAAGEVAIHDDQGQVIHLKRGKLIHIYGCDTLTADVGVQATVTCPLVNVVASTKVTLTTPMVECSQNVQVGGNLQVVGTAAVTGALSSAHSVSDPTGHMQGMRTIYNTHTHPENGDGGGTTSAPNQAM